MQRYKVTVIELKPNKTNSYDDSIRIGEGDVFIGWSRNVLLEGKHFDLWFTPRSGDDPDNFVNFARIVSHVPASIFNAWTSRIKTKFACLDVAKLAEYKINTKTLRLH